MKKVIYILLVATISISCKQFQESPSLLFEKDDVSFTCHKGWSITDEDNLDGQGYYMSIEKDGFDSSGLMTVNWIFDNIDPEDFVAAYQEDLKENVIYKNSNLVFDAISEGKFNTYKVKSIDYQVSIIGVKHQGTILAFSYGDKTFAILKQEAKEDFAQNKKGFELIEKSFRIEKTN